MTPQESLPAWIRPAPTRGKLGGSFSIATCTVCGRQSRVRTSDVRKLHKTGCSAFQFCSEGCRRIGRRGVA